MFPSGAHDNAGIRSLEEKFKRINFTSDLKKNILDKFRDKLIDVSEISSELLPLGRVKKRKLL